MSVEYYNIPETPFIKDFSGFFDPDKFDNYFRNSTIKFNQESNNPFLDQLNLYVVKDSDIMEFKCKVRTVGDIYRFLGSYNTWFKDIGAILKRKKHCVLQHSCGIIIKIVDKPKLKYLSEEESNFFVAK